MDLLLWFRMQVLACLNRLLCRFITTLIVFSVGSPLGSRAEALKAIHLEAQAPGVLDRIVRGVARLLIGPTILDRKNVDLTADLRARDAVLLAVDLLLKTLTPLLDVSLDTAAQALAFVDDATGSRAPPYRDAWALLEAFVANVDLLDLWTGKDDDGWWTLDTRFLDRYELKNGEETCGGVVRLSLGADGVWNAAAITYQGRDHLRGAKDSCAATARVLYGLFVFVTVGSHFCGGHYLSAWKPTAASRRLDPRGETPLRRLLLHTELGTSSGVSRAVASLLARNGVFHTFCPFSFGGLSSFVDDFLREHRSLLPESTLLARLRALPLHDPLVAAFPFHGLTQWARLCSLLASEASGAWPTEALSKWSVEMCGEAEHTASVDAAAYVLFAPIRHGCWSSPWVTSFLPELGRTGAVRSALGWCRLNAAALATSIPAPKLLSTLPEDAECSSGRALTRFRLGVAMLDSMGLCDSYRPAAVAASFAV